MAKKLSSVKVVAGRGIGLSVNLKNLTSFTRLFTVIHLGVLAAGRLL